jgi:WD40 repeat protein
MTAYKKRNTKIPMSTCVNCICFSKNDRFLATGNSNGTISLFNNLTNTFNKPLIYQTHSKMSCLPNVTSIHYSASNIGHLGASYEDGSVVLWDVSKEQPQCVFKEHTSICTSLVSSPINAILMVSGGMDNLLVMYDTSAKK